MKRTSIIISSLLFLNIFFGLKGFAQSDDVYYSPDNDKNAIPAQQTNQGSQSYSGQNENGDYQPDYKLQSSKSYVDSNGNTVTNNYYYSDNDYSSRLERFYGGYCGLGYYDYAFTPAFYWGGCDGFGFGLGYGFGDYWGWGLGWGTCGYYNPWYSPFGIYGCGWGYGYGRWGCGYGYGLGCAYGYGRGWGHGYGHHGWGYGYGEGYGYGREHGLGYAYGAYRANTGGYYFGPKAEARYTSVAYARTSPGNQVTGTHVAQGPGFNNRSAQKASDNNNGWKTVTPKSWNSNSNAERGNSSPRYSGQAPRQSAQQNNSQNYQYRGNSGAGRQSTPQAGQYRSPAPSRSYSSPNTGGGYRGGYSGGNSGGYRGGYSGGYNGGASHSYSGGGGGGSHFSGGGGGGSHFSGGGGGHAGGGGRR